jgi:hypothetical protein
MEYLISLPTQREREGARLWKRIKESSAVTEKLRRELVGRNYQLVRAGLETNFVHAPCMTLLNFFCDSMI